MLAVLSMSPPVAHFSVVQKRPKLSLQTTELPVSYGTSSRGLLTIATPGATTTPTTLNTFNNTYDLTHRPSPTTAAISPSVLRSTSGYDPTSRSQSPRPKRIDATYNVALPFGIKPILKNTPYPRLRTTSISASPRSTTRRVFFPAPKQVVFKNVLEEEIITKVYTARHSDLFQEASNSENGGLEGTTLKENSVSSSKSEDCSSIVITSSERKLCRRNSLDFSTKKSTATPESISIHAATPSSTRKRRRWEWTLGPLPSQTTPSPELESNSNSERPTKQPEPKIKPLPPKPTISIVCQDYPSQTTFAQETATLEPSILLPSQSQPALPTITDPPRRSSTPAIQTHHLSAPLLSPPSPNPHQRRAVSLDGSTSPRKRKAECLLESIASTTSVKSGSSGGESQTGTTRRERAATL